MSRKMKVLFTISVLLNVLFFGLVAGQGYRAAHDRSWIKANKDLAPETRALMKSTFREKRKEIGPMIREMRGSMTKIGEILGAEEFDPQAFDEASEGLKQLNQNMYTHKLETMKGLAAQLPQVEREKLKKKFMYVLMSKGHPHKKHDRSKWHDKGERNKRMGGNGRPEDAGAQSGPASDNQARPVE